MVNMENVEKIRIATYNIHKCKGLDRRVRPERIVEVLQEIDADVIALQEVVRLQSENEKDDQARFIAQELGFDLSFGETRKLAGGDYGNAVLSRLPIIDVRNHDISVHGRERRGCLRVDVDLEGKGLLHVYNTHLGTSFIERRHQARKLFKDEILKNGDTKGPRVLLGDFNEWTRGLASRLLRDHFQCADIRHYIGRAWTYPGVLPLLHLDHIYFDEALKLESAALHRSRVALVASDHLPVVADLRLR